MHPRASWWRHLDSTAAGAAGRIERQVRKTHTYRTLTRASRFAFSSTLWVQGEMLFQVRTVFAHRREDF